ncbi:hypothetical protein EYC80_005621 [Monilinia laxa]|uniref:Uncharacterized protein n=1 Tax=Monilinia laxa TaxID=61186 RepID=A0A5N6KEM1_MONLA|nr:hypothetical protein EYC80_005621 [Monilinia laxa]
MTLNVLRDALATAVQRHTWEQVTVLLGDNTFVVGEHLNLIDDRSREIVQTIQTAPGTIKDSLVDSIAYDKNTRMCVPGKGRPHVASRYRNKDGHGAFAEHSSVELLAGDSSEAMRLAGVMRNNELNYRYQMSSGAHVSILPSSHGG